MLNGFSALLVLSNLMVSAAPDLAFLIVARVLLGAAIGGFWSMAPAAAIRLVPSKLMARAMSLIFSGISVATIVAVPLGSYIGGLWGWRVVFLLAAGIGAVALVVQAATLPRLAVMGDTDIGAVTRPLRRPGIVLGMICIVLVFSAHFGLFTYVRPFLESVPGAQ